MKLPYGVVPMQTVRFINAEPAALIVDGQPAPSVILSFGEEDGPVVDRAICLQDARDMAMDILGSLAHMGDPIAQLAYASIVEVQKHLQEDNEFGENEQFGEDSEEWSE